MDEQKLKRKIQQSAMRIGQITGDGYARAQHNREKLDLNVIPDDIGTAGANNVYWSVGYVVFGVTSLANSHGVAHCQLPSDYVAGENLTLRISYQINQVSAKVDYDVEFKFARDGMGFAVANNPTGQWTADGTANRINHEDLTITGTNILPNDDLRIELAMDDNSATDNVKLLSLKLFIPVNKRD